MSAGETLGVEDPGYPDVINMASIEGIRVRRLPIDSNGLLLTSDTTRCKCIFVTPSHQFPTTVTMPLDRKLELLELTKKSGQFVIEDDYEADISFNMTPAPRPQEPRRLGKRHLYGQPLEVAAARAAHRLPGGGSRVHPRGESSSPPPPSPPAGQQPAKRGALPPTRILRPVRREAHRHLQGAMRRGARVSRASLSGRFRQAGIRRRHHLVAAPGRGGCRNSAGAGRAPRRVLRDRGDSPSRTKETTATTSASDTR